MNVFLLSKILILQTKNVKANFYLTFAITDESSEATKFAVKSNSPISIVNA